MRLRVLIVAFAIPSALGAQAPRLAAGARASESSALAREWDAKLRGKRLTLLSRINGGTSGGGTSEKRISLCRDGRFVYFSESSVSVYVPGANGSSSNRESEEGVWRILVRESIPVIEVIAKADTGYIGIGWDERARTYLNGERAYVTDEPERCTR
jgi:hypothetical protein